MKSRNGLRKPIKDIGADDQKKTRKLKPQAKQKNVRNLLYREIEDLDGVELGLLNHEEADLEANAEEDEEESD